MPTFSIALQYHPGEVVRLLKAVEAFLEPFAPPAKVLRHFLLAIEEIALNAIVHGVPENPSDLRLDIAVEGGALTCRMVDAGPPFDPFTQAPEPDLSSPVEERRVGGLGVYLTKKLMDVCTYERRGGRNHTLLVKKLG